MVREDRVILRVKELRRVHGIRQTREKTEAQVKAGPLLGLTPRHLRRLIARVEQADGQGLADRGAREALEPADPGEGPGQGADARCGAL